MSGREEVEEYLSFLTSGSEAHTTLVLFSLQTGKENLSLTTVCGGGGQGERTGTEKKRWMLCLLSKNMPKSELAEMEKKVFTMC